MESKYLTFEEVAPLPARKTKIILVKSTSSRDILGTIKWYGPWRQYCFYPVDMCIFNKDCMQTIIERIDNEMRKRNNERQNRTS